jgi:DinB family protein
VVTFVLVDDPGDRAEFIAEAVRVLSARIERERARLLELVAAASDANLAAGTADDWGLGQIALHLLTVERGICGIALRLARGELAGPTGQPRPAAGSATRESIASLAAKAQERLARTVAEFPRDPNTTTTARQPYYGEMNCFGWLLTIPLHYEAHLAAVERGTRSAL